MLTHFCSFFVLLRSWSTTETINFAATTTYIYVSATTIIYVKCPLFTENPFNLMVMSTYKYCSLAKFSFSATIIKWQLWRRLYIQTIRFNFRGLLDVDFQPIQKQLLAKPRQLNRRFWSSWQWDQLDLTKTETTQFAEIADVKFHL